MRLFIAIGYPAKNAEPELVYLGRDGAAYEAACKAAPFPLIEKFPNPRGIRKNNGAAAENAKVEQAAFDAEVAAEQANYNAAVQLKARELAGAKIAELNAALAERDAELESLRAALKEGKKSKAS